VVDRQFEEYGQWRTDVRTVVSTTGRYDIRILCERGSGASSVKVSMDDMICNLKELLNIQH
jgi:hypothetical protein